MRTARREDSGSAQDAAAGRRGPGGLKGLGRQHHREWGDEEMEAEMKKEKAVSNHS